MFQSTIIDISLQVDHPQPETKTKLLNFFFTEAYLISSRFVLSILSLAATVIHDGLLTPLRNLWDTYYPRLALLEEHALIPPSAALRFIITVLLAFAAIKSQCQPGFPFNTHPHLVSFSIDCFVMYGLSYAARLVASVQKQGVL